MSPKLSRDTAWKYGHWITPTLYNNLGKFTSGTRAWGTLSWTQTFPGDSKGYAKVDILKASDESVLVSDLTWNSEGIDLSEYSAIVETQDIKLKFKLWKKTESPIITKIGIRFKQEW